MDKNTLESVVESLTEEPYPRIDKQAGCIVPGCIDICLILKLPGNPAKKAQKLIYQGDLLRLRGNTCEAAYAYGFAASEAYKAKNVKLIKIINQKMIQLAAGLR